VTVSKYQNKSKGLADLLREIKKNPMYGYLLILTVGAALGLQGWRTIFNNFAVDVVGINGLQVGVIQSAREIPGFLSLLVIYLLLFMKEHRLSALAVIICGAGVFLTGFLPTYHGLIITTVIMSIGFHYFETTNQSLTLQYFNKEQSPIVFARLRSLNSLTNIFVGAAIWILAEFFELPVLFAIVGFVVILTGFYAFRINPVIPGIKPQHRKMILKKKYTLFYILNLMSGARRQIFVVFAVFLLVKKYNYSVQWVTALFVLNNLINYFLVPYIAKAINRFGERKVLSLEYFALFFVFLAYAFIDSPVVAAVLYVIDHIFFNFAIGIKTYFQKTADPADIAPSMAVGFTINHIAAVVIPVFGGSLWLVDYRIPFLAGSVMALLSLFFVQFIKYDVAGQGADNE